MIATSITGDNLRDGLWAEMAKWQQRSRLLMEAFTWTKTRIFANDHPDTWFMSARQWSKSSDSMQQADTLAGLHADYILFLIDEVGGVPDAVAVAAEAALSTGIECKLIIAGNPTNLSGPLYRACTSEASLWKVIEITGDPDDPKRSSRIDIKWAREQIAKYGRDNPWVLINVFGKFPPSSLNALLGPDDMEAAFRRSVTPDSYAAARKILGVDVARQGSDSTVIAPRQGIVGFKPRVLRIADTIQIAGEVAKAIRNWGAEVVNIDATGGWGYGVIDTLRSWGHTVNDINFSSKAFDRQFANRRAEMAWNFAAWVKQGGCLPDMPELREEATAITYTHTESGDKLILEDKDIIKERLGRSPDLFDAFSLTFAIPTPAKTPLEMILDAGGFAHRANNQVEDYDPLRYDAHTKASWS